MIASRTFCSTPSLVPLRAASALQVQLEGFDCSESLAGVSSSRSLRLARSRSQAACRRRNDLLALGLYAPTGNGGLLVSSSQHPVTTGPGGVGCAAAQEGAPLVRRECALVSLRQDLTLQTASMEPASFQQSLSVEGVCPLVSRNSKLAARGHSVSTPLF